MDGIQLDEFLEELRATRKSLDAAVSSIRWNKINTIIQYILVMAVFIMGSVGVVYYFDDRKEACERGNELRLAIVEAFDSQAASIGIALSVVAGAEPDEFRQYLEVYANQPKPEALNVRGC